MQSIYKDRVKNEIRKHNDINEDINFLQETDYIYRPVQENIISAYENETQTREKPKVIDFLKNKIYHLLERIENLIHLQDFLHIERKNKIEMSSRPEGRLCFTYYFFLSTFLFTLLLII
jgi:hypothetical protein